MKTSRSLFQWWPIYLSGLLACTGVTVAAWMLAIGPSIDQLHQRAVRLQQLSERHQKSTKLTASLNAMKRKQAGTLREISLLDLRLEPPTGANARMAAVTRLANECGLTVDEVRPGQTLDFPHYQTLALSVSGSGPYPALAKLLHRMHQEMRDTSVQALDIGAGNGGISTTAVQFRLDFVWYASRSTKAAPAVAATE